MTELLTRPSRPTSTVVDERSAGVAPTGRPAETAGSGSTQGDGRTGEGLLGWVRLVLATAARAVLVALTCLALWGAVPAVLGWHSTTVVTGSMEPKIVVGDVAVSMPAAAEALVPGRVLLFDDPDHQGRLRFHRMVSFDEQGLLVTRGDANDADDSTHVDPATVRGIGVLRIPWIGLPVVWLREQQLLLVAAAALGLTVLVALSGLDRQLRREDGPGGGPGTPAGRGTARRASTARPTGPDRAGVAARRALPAPRSVPSLRAAPVMRGAVAVLTLPVLVLTAVLSVGGTAWSAVTSETTSPTARLAAASWYRCSDAQLADRPYLLHRLDETPTSGGAVVNATGGNRDGVYRGSARRSDAACVGEEGGSVNLNGTSQYISSTAEITRNPTVFTLEAWIRTGSKQGRIIGFGNQRVEQSGQYDRHLYINSSGRLVFGVYTDTTKTIVSPSTVTDGEWHHVVATLGSGTSSVPGMALYVDGERVARDSSTRTAEPYDGYWKIGWDNLSGWPGAPSSSYFRGSLDNVAVYTRVLSASEVAEHHRAGQ